MSQKKIKILVIQTDTKGGVGFFRSFQPHQYIEKKYGDEFIIDYATSVDWSDIEKLKQYNIIHFHKGVCADVKQFYNTILALKESNTVTVLDVDDSWELTESHPLFSLYTQYGFSKMIETNIKLFDYVTTTTDYFAQRIFKLNHHVEVLPNAIDDKAKNFQIKKTKSKLIRIGLILGSAHENDVKILDKISTKLPKQILEKVQFVLCGFNTEGTIRLIDKENNKVTTRVMFPHETVWKKYEDMITDNYSIISYEYRKILNMYAPHYNDKQFKNEHYRRFWTKPIDSYFSHYSNCDILLAPLEENIFNYVKSELKAIECCFSKTALIASNFGPYHLTLSNALQNNIFNENGNAILIDEDKNETDWVKAITYLVENPDKIKTLQTNIYNSFKEKYSLENVTKKRVDFYRKISEYSK